MKLLECVLIHFIVYGCGIQHSSSLLAESVYSYHYAVHTLFTTQ